MTLPPQSHLNAEKIANFYIDCFVESQLRHFFLLTKSLAVKKHKYIVDVGGGCGYFANALHSKTGRFLRVIDRDRLSIEVVNSLKNINVQGVIGDALCPPVTGDESIICFNLILHHLVAKTDQKTKDLQKRAILLWKDNSDYIFINEYVYDSYFANISGLLIYVITSNRMLSAIAEGVSRVIPSLRANTFGVGVRFRAHDEWVKLFENCGYSIVSKLYGDPEYISFPRRLLLIKSIRRDSFLLRISNQ